MLRHPVAALTNVVTSNTGSPERARFFASAWRGLLQLVLSGEVFPG